MLQRWRHVRQFLPHLFKTMEFQANEAGQPILEAWQFLQSIEGVRKPNWSSVPLRVVTTKSWWRLLVDENGEMNRKAYTFCVLQALRSGLRRRDVFVSPSRRWGKERSSVIAGRSLENR